MTRRFAPSSRRAVLHGSTAVGASAVAVLGVRSLAEAATGSGSADAALAAATSCPTVTKEETEGPYWIDEQLNRSDVRYDTGSASTSTTTPVGGVPLTLTVNLTDTCLPHAGAYVDIWHCNAGGINSDVSAGAGNTDQVGRPQVPARLPDQRRQRQRHLHDGLPGLVLRPHHPHPRAGPHVARIEHHGGLHHPDLLRRHGQRPGPGADQQGLQGRDGARPAQLDRRALRREPADGGHRRHHHRLLRHLRRLGADPPGQRMLKIGITPHERVAAKILLLEDDNVLAKRSTGWLGTRRRAIGLRVPDSVRAGTYHVQVALADHAGHKKITRRLIHLPKA